MYENFVLFQGNMNSEGTMELLKMHLKITFPLFIRAVSILLQV